MTTTEIWLATEYHGYHFAFSTREKAEEWLDKEIKDTYEDYSRFEDESNSYGRYVYCNGELVGRYEKIVLDETDQ